MGEKDDEREEKMKEEKMKEEKTGAIEGISETEGHYKEFSTWLFCSLF